MKNFLKIISLFFLKAIGLTLLFSTLHAKDIDTQDFLPQKRPPFFLQSPPTFVTLPLDVHELPATHRGRNAPGRHQSLSLKAQIFMLRLFKFPFLPPFTPKIKPTSSSKEENKDIRLEKLMGNKNLLT